MKIRECKEGFWADFSNGVSVEVRLSDKTFGGLGRVRCGKRELRSPQLPIMPLIATPYGHEVCGLELGEMQADGDELRMAFRPYVRLAEHARSWQDGRAALTVDGWGQAPVRDRGGQLSLTLKQVDRLAGAVQLAGFSYSYAFRSRKHRPQCIHDRSTWELNGCASGNTLIMRSLTQPAIKSFRSMRDDFSTALRNGGGEVAQFLSLFSQLQGFTFQYDRLGLLVTAFETPFHCPSLVQKNAGHNYIIHWHQLAADGPNGGGSMAFPALEVMYASGRARDGVDRLNQYEDIRSDIYRRYRSALGLQAEPASCAARVHCDGLARPANLKGAVEDLAASGCSEVVVTNLFSTEQEKGADDPPLPVSEHVLKWARRIAELARGMEMQVGALVSAAQVADGLPHDPAQSGGRQGRGKAIRRALSRLKKQIALDSLLVQWDGGGRAAPDTSVDVRVEADVHLRVQQQGLRCACGRSGVLGVSTAQVPYALIRGNELLFRDSAMPFPYEETLAAGDDPLRAYFRGYANRVCYSVGYRCGVADQGVGMDAWWGSAFAAVNRAYRAVSEHMERPRLLPDGRGVLWDGNGDEVHVLWSYAAFEWEVGDEAQVYDVMGVRAVPLNEGLFNVTEGRVYLVQDALAP